RAAPGDNGGPPATATGLLRSAEAGAGPVRRGVLRGPFALVRRPGSHLSRFATRLATATRPRSDDVPAILGRPVTARQASAELACGNGQAACSLPSTDGDPHQRRPRSAAWPDGRSLDPPLAHARGDPGRPAGSPDGHGLP